MDTSFAAKSCFGGSGSKRKLTPYATSTLTQNNANKIATINKNGNKPLKRTAPMPPPSNNENEENILRNKTADNDNFTPEKRLSKLYKFISNDKMRSTTRGILKKTTQNNNQQKQNNQQSNNTTTDHDPTYGFASRYSDSKSYFRTQNVDNTIPRAVQREDLLMEYVPVEGGGNFRDVLFPLRASNGSNKSTHNIKAAEVEDEADAATWSLPANLKENFQDFNIATPPQKKRVKFDESLDNLYDKKQQQPSAQPFEFQRDMVLASGGAAAGSRNSLRERIYDFFANLF